MKVLHIIKQEPDESTCRIIEAHRAANAVTVVDLRARGISYDALITAVFESDRVICW